MGNMSYCRFENTYRDLADCYDALTEEGLEEYYDNASPTEKRNIGYLILMCKNIVDDFYEEEE